MKTLSRIAHWFDQAHERAGWLVIVWGLGLTTAVVVAILRGVVVPWQVVGVLVGLVALGVLTLLGVSYFNGIQIGRDGVSVSNWSRNQDAEE